MRECTEVPAYGRTTTSQWWQSWGTTARYLVGQFAQASPHAALVWMYLHR